MAKDVPDAIILPDLTSMRPILLVFMAATSAPKICTDEQPTRRTQRKWMLSGTTHISNLFLLFDRKCPSCNLRLLEEG